MIVMPERYRGQVVHGWAFREDDPEVVSAIRAFLASGLRADLPGDYRGLFDLVAEQQKVTR